jgi:transposase
MSFIQPSDRQQFTMMGALDDLIAPDHPVRLLDELIERIVRDNPEHFGVERPGEVGRPQYAPATMLKLYLYGNINGIRSSRKLEMETKRNVELIWLLGTLSPDHWTIAQYRKEYGDQIKAATTAVRQFLRQQGYVRAERIAIDGSKVKANARRDMLTAEKIAKRLAGTDEELERYLALLAENDRRDDVAEDLSDDDPTKRETALIDKIIALQQQVEELTHHQEQLRVSGKTYISPADPEATLMKSRDGILPAYNVQIAVDAAAGFIAASEVITDATDIYALPIMAKAVEGELHQHPAEYIADRGYYNPDLLEQVEHDHGVRCYVGVKESAKHPASSDRITFTYDKEHDYYWCSEGKPLPLLSRKKKRHSIANVYQGTDCHGCPVRALCTTSNNGRQINRYHNHDWRERYKERLRSPIARIRSQLRKCLVENPFGTMKCLAGKIPLLLRGRAKVATEINLLTTAFNLKKLFNLKPFGIIYAEITSQRWAIV